MPLLQLLERFRAPIRSANTGPGSLRLADELNGSLGKYCDQSGLKSWWHNCTMGAMHKLMRDLKTLVITRRQKFDERSELGHLAGVSIFHHPVQSDRKASVLPSVFLLVLKVGRST